MKTLLPILALTTLLAACGSADIQGVKTYTFASGNHQEGRLTYAQTPPAGGPHNPGWQNCGVYTRPLFDEFAVHSLEHGAVWVTYRPDLPAASVATLTGALQDRPYVLLSPHVGQTAPVVATAWGAQLPLERADDARLNRFVQKYAQSPQSPEPGAPCSGAISTTQ